MSGYVTLVGAEDVVSAGLVMRQAAESIRQSIGHLEEVLRIDREKRDEQLELLRCTLEDDRVGRVVE